MNTKTYRLRWIALGCLAALAAAAALDCSKKSKGVSSSPKAPVARSAPLKLLKGLPGTQVKSGKAQLRHISSVKVLTLAGSPEQRGRDQGTLLRKEIQKLVKEYLHGFVVKRLGGREMVMVVARAAEMTIPAEVKTEMKALAAAASVTYEDILMLNTHVDAMAVGCSTAVVLRGASAEGKLTMARNLDWPAPPGLKNLAVLVVTRPEKGKPFANYTYPGFLGVLTGLNSSGVAVAMNVSPSSDNARTCVPTPIVLRSALLEASSASDLLQRVAKAQRCSGFLITAADTKNDAAVVEISASQLARRGPVKGILMSTNHYLTKPMKKLQEGRVPDSKKRFRALRKGIKKGISILDLGVLMSGPPIFNKTTLMSLLVSPEELKMWLWERGMTVGGYISVDLRKSLGSP